MDNIRLVYIRATKKGFNCMSRLNKHIGKTKNKLKTMAMIEFIEKIYKVNKIKHGSLKILSKNKLSGFYSHALKLAKRNI